MRAVKTTPRKRPRQARSRATVEAILEATVRVLVARGYQGTTTIAVAARAGVSVGSLYQYFPNKESLVAALVDRHKAELVACVEAALAAAPEGDPRAAVRAFIRAGIDAHRIHPALHKVLAEQVPRVGRLKAAMDTSKALAARLAAYLARHRARLAVDDPEVAAFVVETAVEALVHRVVIERPEQIGTARLEAEATDLVMGYLFEPRR
jgi:AcrR family transcriptional regulator